MKLSVSAYRAHASAHKKILSSSYQSTLNYGSTAASCSSTQASELFSIDPMTEPPLTAGQVAATMMSGNSGHAHHSHHHSSGTKNEQMLSPTGGDAQTTTTTSVVTSKDDEESSDCKSPGQRENVQFNCD